MVSAVLLSRLLVSLGYSAPVLEYRFDSVRRWRFDLCWPELKLAAEIEGGTWVQGRHIRPKGYENDCEKYNAAVLAGWRVFRFTTAMIGDGRAIATLEATLERTVKQ